jgi:dihydrodipicolinate synthase/N-acetylneuraminate lyase
MFDFWTEELTPEEEEKLLDKAAESISKRGLIAPAIMALELHKPLANVGAHAALAVSPFLIPFFGFSPVNDYSRLMRKRENFERLIQKLESYTPVQGGKEVAS